jgi:hypothetical protein
MPMFFQTLLFKTIKTYWQSNSARKLGYLHYLNSRLDNLDFRNTKQSIKMRNVQNFRHRIPHIN